MSFLTWQIGDVRITRVKEFEMVGLEWVVEKASPENLRGIPWLAPHFVDDQWEAVLSIHALVVETPDRKIVVDTCVGNDKNLPCVAESARQRIPYLPTQRLARRPIGFLGLTARAFGSPRPDRGLRVPLRNERVDLLSGTERDRYRVVVTIRGNESPVPGPAGPRERHQCHAVGKHPTNLLEAPLAGIDLLRE